jgi:hypothetical protein
VGNYFRLIPPFTGGTVSGDTFFLGSVSSNTFFSNSISGNTIFSGNTNLYNIFSTVDYFTTGSTFDSNTKIATFNRNDGNNYTLDLSTLSTVDTFVTGFTYDGTNTFTVKQNEGQPDLAATINNLSINNFSASTIFSGNTNLYNIFSTRDYFTTGSTFDSNTKIATFNRNDGNNYTLDLSTLSTVDTFVTGFTYDDNTNTFSINQNEGQSPLTATIDTISLSGSLSSITFDIQTTGDITAANFFGNGSNLSGITDYFTTGSTFNSNTKIATFNRNDGNNYSLDLSTLSTVDTYVTGFTYDNNNTFTIKQNEGKPDLSVIINNLSVNSFSAQTITSNGLSGATDRFIEVNSIGLFSATKEIINAYINSGSTEAVLLGNTNNWDINGNYTGSAITGTFQGQKYYNNNYFFEAVDDNLWIRLIRG